MAICLPAANDSFQVRLADKIRCVRDNGMWKDCDGGSSVSDLVADIDKLYNTANSPGIN
jgi:hypothetical protein